MIEVPWYANIHHRYAGYRTGDAVVATINFQDIHSHIFAGTVDKIESVSSDHHGGLQLNLVRYGRGWTNDVWKRPTINPSS